MSSPKLKERLFRSFTVVTKTYGEAVCFKGDTLNAFYIIHSGTCGAFGAGINEVVPDSPMRRVLSTQTHGVSSTAPSAARSPVTEVGPAATQPELMRMNSKRGHRPSLAGSKRLDSLSNMTGGHAKPQRMLSMRRMTTSKRMSLEMGKTKKKEELISTAETSPSVTASPKATLEALRVTTNEETENKALPGMSRAPSIKIPTPSGAADAGTAAALDSDRSSKMMGSLMSQASEAKSSFRTEGGERLVGEAKFRRKARRKDSMMDCERRLGAKEWFGEASLLTSEVADSTVRAMEEVTLLVLPRQRFLEVRLEVEQNDVSTRQELIRKTPFAPALNAEQIANLADACDVAIFNEGDRIASEADSYENEAFLMVLEGTAEEAKKEDTKDEQPARQFFPGDSMCEWALEYGSKVIDLSAVRLNPTIVATARCVCLSMNRHIFSSLVGSYDGVMAEVRREDERRRKFKKNLRSFNTSGAATPSSSTESTQQWSPKPTAGGPLTDQWDSSQIAKSVSHDAGSVPRWFDDDGGRSETSDRSSPGPSRRDLGGAASLRTKSSPGGVVNSSPLRTRSSKNGPAPIVTSSGEREGSQEGNSAGKRGEKGREGGGGGGVAGGSERASSREGQRSLGAKAGLPRAEAAKGRRASGGAFVPGRAGSGAGVGARREKRRETEPGREATAGRQKGEREAATEREGRERREGVREGESTGSAAGDMEVLVEGNESLEPAAKTSDDESPQVEVPAEASIDQAEAGGLVSVRETDEAAGRWLEINAVVRENEEGGEELPRNLASKQIGDGTTEEPRGGGRGGTPEEVGSATEEDEEDAEIVDLEAYRKALRTPNTDDGAANQGDVAPGARDAGDVQSRTDDKADVRSPAVPLGSSRAAGQEEEAILGKLARQGSEREGDNTAAGAAAGTPAGTVAGTAAAAAAAGTPGARTPAAGTAAVQAEGAGDSAEVNRLATSSGDSRAQEDEGDVGAARRTGVEERESAARETSGDVTTEAPTQGEAPDVGVAGKRGDGSQYVSAGFLSVLEDAARKLQHAEEGEGQWHGDDDDENADGETRTRSLPRTPGGTVIMNPVSWHNTPSFKSPGATPVHSTGHSRAQSRQQSRGHSRGGRGTLSSPTEEALGRRRSKPSHLMATEDEFAIPAGAEQEEYPSDDEVGTDFSGQYLPAPRRSRLPPPYVRSKTAEPVGCLRPGQPRPFRARTTFGMSPNKTSTELVMEQAREIPGPADYDLRHRRRRRGWTFNAAQNKSQVDSLQESAAQRPGPGDYELGEVELPAGGRISGSVTPGMFSESWRSPGPSHYRIPQLHQRTTVKISHAPRLTSLEALAQTAASFPGPGQYEHDADWEEEMVSRARRSVSREYASRERSRARRAAQKRAEEATNNPTFEVNEKSVAAGRLRSSSTWYGDLPASSELCFELRSRVPIQRAYLEQGIELT